jgi:hypothetical protein
MLRTKNIITLILISSIAFLSSCDKDFDSPPIKTLPEGNIITIDSLRNIYNGADITFTEDYSIYGVITADASTGNIYKELYIQDETNAIKLSLTSSADYFIGDKIRVAIKGAILTDDGGRNMITLEEVDPDIAIIKQESGQDLSPTVVTITELTTLVNNLSSYQSQLVQINNLEFVCGEVCNTWANSIAQSDENRTLIDTLGNTIIVRSSGFATFAGTPLPFGSGSIIAVVSQYNSTIQLTIRNPNEATLYGTRKYACAPCPTINISKDFEDQSITSGGWSTQVVTGSFDWGIDNAGGGNSYYAKISNFNSGNTTSEAWLISPSFDFSTSASASLAFRNAANFTGSDLELFVSTDYDGLSMPSTATWTPLNFTLSLGGFAFVASGSVDLSSFLGANTYVAFKYTGSNSDGKTWELDDINIIAL